MRKLLGYFKQYTKECIIGPMFKMLEAIFELIVPLVIANIINNGIEQKDFSYIIKCALLLMLFAIVGYVCATIAQYLSSKAAIGIASDIRRDLFKHIFGMSNATFEKNNSSRLLTSLTGDVNQIQSGINLTLRLLLRSPFIVFGAIVMSFIVSKKLSVIFLIVVMILTLIIFLNLKKSIPSYSETRAALDNVVTKTNDAISGVRIIRGFCKTSEEEQLFYESNNTLKLMQNVSSKITSVLNPATFLIINASICTLIYFGAIDVSVGDLSQGDVVALYNYMSQILVELIKLANLIIQLSKAIACGNRVSKILEIDIIDNNNNAIYESSNSKRAIHVENVSYKYSNSDKESISNISFDLDYGKKLGIVGKTGCGKSTLGAIIASLNKPTNGQIIYNCNEDIRIGYVMQKNKLFSGTIEANIRLGRDYLTEDDINNAIYSSSSDDFVFKKNDGIYHELSQGGKNLSGGQKQRLGIARAIVNKPHILVMDDATSALDAITEKKVNDNISNFDWDLAIVIISQKIKSVIKCDEILVLDEGRIIGKGTHNELLSTCNLYRELFELQHPEASDNLGGAHE